MTEGEQEKNVIQVIVEDTSEEGIAEPATSSPIDSMPVTVADPGETEVSEKVLGTNFTIDGNMATIFGQTGKKGLNGQWDRPFGTQWRGAAPEPKSEMVLAAIQEDIDHNVCDPTNRVIISPDVALFLFLEGVLKPEHFKTADESRVNTAPIFNEQDETLDPAITLSSVTFGTSDDAHAFPVTILKCIGLNQAFTLDKNWGRI